MAETILIVDDDERVRQTFSRNLALAGYDVLDAPDGSSALRIHERERPDVTIVDMHMPGIDGLGVLAAIRECDRDAEVILTTGHGNKEEVIEALRMGASDFIAKPIDVVGLEAALRRARERMRLKEELNAARETLRESEERYRITSELVSDYAYALQVTPDGKFVLEWVTDAFTHITGFTSEESQSRGGWARLIYPDDLPAAHRRLRNLLAGEDDTSEFRIVTKRGEIRWLCDHGRPIWDEDQGRVVRIIGAVQDITERKQAQQALRDHQSRLEDEVAERTHDLGERVKELRCLYQTSDLIATLGLTLEEIMQRIVDCIPPAWQYPEVTCARLVIEDQAFSTAGFQETAWQQSADVVVGRGSVGILTVGYLEERPTSDEGPFLNEERDLINAIAEQIGRVTEQKQTEATLRELSQFLELTLDALSANIAILDEEGTIVAVNASWRRFGEQNGLEWEDAGVGRNYLEVVDQACGVAEGAAAVAQGIRDLLSVQCGEFSATYPCHSPTEERWFTMRVTCFEGSEGVGLVVSHENVTRRKRAEEALLESENRYRTLVENAPLGIGLASVDGRIVTGNEAICEILGCSLPELKRSNVRDFYLHPEQRDVLVEHLQRDGCVRGFEAELVRVDGSMFDASVTVNRLTLDGQPMLLTVLQDVTEQKRMEAQLKKYTEELESRVEEKVRELEFEQARFAQAARLAALGEMATGVAHELNQPLTAMLFEADYLRTLAERARQRGDLTLSFEVEELRRLGDNLATDISRSRRITDYLRAFSRFSREGETHVDLNRPVEDSFILSEARLQQNNIAVYRDLAPDLPPVWANQSKLEQVFLTLVNNAEYALREMARRIETGEAKRSDYQKTLRISTSLEGEWVVARISDNGCGIPEAEQACIFEPFYTIASLPEGSGLGLFASRDIITALGGEMTFESRENEGTTFVLRFPVLDSEAG